MTARSARQTRTNNPRSTRLSTHIAPACILHILSLENKNSALSRVPSIPFTRMMSQQQAFLPPHPLLHSVRSIHQPTICSATPPRRRPARPLSILTAALLTTLTPILPVQAKELRYDGRQELDSTEKAMSLTLTGGTFATLAVWAWKQNRRDDELEEIRIKDEVERLEKLKAEFMDVEDDDESIDDEDLLASLRERIGEEEGDEKDKAESTEEDSDVDMLKRMWDATDDDDKTKS